jgi:hypothetical protein
LTADGGGGTSPHVFSCLQPGSLPPSMPCTSSPIRPPAAASLRQRHSNLDCSFAGLPIWYLCSRSVASVSRSPDLAAVLWIGRIGFLVSRSGRAALDRPHRDSTLIQGSVLGRERPRWISCLRLHAIHGHVLAWSDQDGLAYKDGSWMHVSTS